LGGATEKESFPFLGAPLKVTKASKEEHIDSCLWEGDIKLSFANVNTA
jgi:hypothetical protein